ncbi:MAG: hypothetical protein ACKVT2_15565 [Saprospiraceae bacterium]
MKRKFSYFLPLAIVALSAAAFFVLQSSSKKNLHPGTDITKPISWQCDGTNFTGERAITLVIDVEDPSPVFSTYEACSGPYAAPYSSIFDSWKGAEAQAANNPYHKFYVTFTVTGVCADGDPYEKVYALDMPPSPLPNDLEAQGYSNVNGQNRRYILKNVTARVNDKSIIPMVSVRVTVKEPRRNFVEANDCTDCPFDHNIENNHFRTLFTAFREDFDLCTVDICDPAASNYILFRTSDFLVDAINCGE